MKYTTGFAGAGVLAIALLASTAVAQEAPVTPETEAASNPQWVRRPTPAFPQAAQRRGVNQGRAVIHCAIKADGRLDDCVVLEEDPPGLGFGREGLRAARRARATPSPTGTEGETTFPLLWWISE